VLVERFLTLMRPRCITLRELELDTWWDRRILVGENWSAEIARALETADFGLLAVTPSFLASPYVTEVELPALLAGEKLTFPVGLEAVDLRRADLQGLEGRQIFRHHPEGTTRQLWFAECAGANRARFCDSLVAQMVDRMTPVPVS
jgi:TIR domain